MKRYLFIFAICVSLSACNSKPSVTQSPKTENPVDRFAVNAKALPKEWRIEDIVDAMPPRSDRGPTFILAWKILEDNRPIRVSCCLGLKQLETATKNQGRWVLAVLIGNPEHDRRWEFKTIWLTPKPDFSNPPFIMYIQEYHDRPTNSDIEKFMDKFEWKHGNNSDWKLVDGGVCEEWEKVIGEKPIRTFRR